MFKVDIDEEDNNEICEKEENNTYYKNFIMSQSQSTEISPCYYKDINIKTHSINTRSRSKDKLSC